MPQKRGDLRVLKQGRSIYGPMSVADLKQLVEQGRVSVTDMVSTDGGAWRLISEFFAETAAQSSPAPTASKDVAAAPANSPAPSPPKNLQVLHGDKIYGPLTRGQVDQLLAASRLTIDDLICAIDGPWMPMADFLAPTRRENIFHPVTRPANPAAAPEAAPAAPATIVQVSPAAAPAKPEDALWFLPPARQAAKESAPATPELTLAEPDEAELAVLEVVDEPPQSTAAPAQAPSLLDELRHESAPVQKSEWFVIVRGIPSAHLTISQLRTLLMAKEVHADTPTSHVSWGSTDWRPLKTIRELAPLARLSSG